ncbi:SHOCT domain-containing protein [Actinomadura sp. NPDC000600]|uniref:SHOCT domain-containing protein n=1 Tax=Actinomadura sp. NPDC000600 TaxID=3154262 RepID=UPI0033983024
MTNAPDIGSKVKPKKLDRIMEGLHRHLHTDAGEAVVLVTTTNSVRPTLDHLVLTNARVMGTTTSEAGTSKGIKAQVWARDVQSFDFRKSFTAPHRLVVTTHDGDEVSFGDVPTADVDAVRAGIDQMMASPPSEAITAAAAEEDIRRQESEALSDARPSLPDSTIVIGQPPSQKAVQQIMDHAGPEECPWLVIGAGSGGVFAALDDRVMIVKVGGLTSFMAGSLGGGRITTFHFNDITGIEYNAGMVNGVLEVLTPSYSGTANKDFWRGSTKGRNADANDPYTLSNTLPLLKSAYQQALPHLNELRRRIGDHKRPQGAVSGQPQPNAPTREGLVEKIEKLAELHSNGVLDDEEFRKAKEALLRQE